MLSDDLAAQVARDAALTVGQAGLTTQDILDILTAELQTEITNLVVATSQEFLLFTESLQLLPGVDRYRIPARALGGRLRHLVLRESGRRIGLTRVSREDLDGTAQVESRLPDRFYLEGNDIVFTARPSSDVASILDMTYFATPSRLVPSAQCRQIVSIDGSTVSLNSVPLQFGSGGVFDVVDATEGGTLLHASRPATVSGSTLVFDAPLALARVGDWVCIERTAPKAMAPAIVLPLLVALAVASVGRLRGIDRVVESAMAKARRLSEQLSSFLQPRVDSAPDMVIGRAPLIPGR